MNKIELPKLPDGQAQEIKAAYAAGESVGTIRHRTGLPYTTVYFYAVNGGKPAEAGVPERKRADNCWCGKPHKAKGLCEYHYKRMRQYLRRAA